MHTAPQQCPTCGHTLDIRELSCPECTTVVRGRWTAGPFARLTPDQQTFLTLFVRSRGNLSEVERSLGVSYPTVRAKLEEIIEVLNELPDDAGRSASADREEILERIARRELSPAEGLRLLRQTRPADASE